MRKLLVPILVGSLLMNVPGFFNGSAGARLGFLAIALVGWISALVYEKRAANVMDGILLVIDKIFEFMDKRFNSTRICSATSLMACTIYAAYMHEGMLPFLMLVALICTIGWTCIEVVVTTFDVYAAREKAEEERQRLSERDRRYRLLEPELRERLGADKTSIERR